MKDTALFARQLRKNLTETEQYLWQRLRRKQLGGFRFRRQVPIGTFIADFACLEQKIIVELDGGQHADQELKDRLRTQWFANEGYRVLRFWDHEVFQQTEGVLETILSTCANHPPPHPLPSREGEEHNR